MPEALPTLSTLDVIVRVLVAGALGGAVGFEREFTDQPAGFRTHILVSLGAALFTLVGAYGVGEFFGDSQSVVRFDPTRVAAQVVTGIGFLGAGAIIQQGLNVRGLTTAAALWVTAAIGVAVALGYWTGAVATTALTVAALYGLKRLERVLFRRLKRGRYEFSIAVAEHLRLTDLTRIVESHRGRVEAMRMTQDEAGRRRLVAVIVLPTAIEPEVIARDLRSAEGVDDVDWGE